MNGNLLGRLRITRPLVFLDLETTGLDPRVDRIVEISIMKVYPPGPDGEMREPEVRTRRVHPGIPIPPGVTAIHGITDADVALEPPFAAYARSLFEQFEGCDFAGFGVRRFDLPLLQAEFKRAGFTFELAGRHCVDGKEIFQHHSRVRGPRYRSDHVAPPSSVWRTSARVSGKVPSPPATNPSFGEVK